MPLAVESLTPESSMPAIREAISKSIQTCIDEGKDQRECAGMSYDIARDKTGKELGEGTTR